MISTKPTKNQPSNVLDIRNKNLISYSKTTNRFFTSISDLAAAGIEPIWHRGVVNSNYHIWLWSSKSNQKVPYIQNRHIRDENYDIIATVFVPLNGHLYEGVFGTELHILND